MNSRASGQILILAVFVGILLLLGVPLLVYMNQVGSFHQALTEKRAKARTIAENGLAYAIQILSVNNSTWQNALGTGPAPGFPAECTSGAILTSASGGHFKLDCERSPTTTATDLEPYQISIFSTAYVPGPNGTDIPTRALQAYVSQRTLGIDTATGIHAAAAMELVNVPSPNPTNPITYLSVHWGPIVSLDATYTFFLGGTLDSVTIGANTYVGFPRKFSPGLITGPAPHNRAIPSTAQTPNTTDRQEYWAQLQPRFHLLVNDDTTVTATSGYSVAAKAETGLPAVANYTQTAAGSGYYSPNTAGAVFNFPSTSLLGSIIYINGSAEIDNLAIDLGTNGAIIVAGDLILGPSGGAPGPGITTLAPDLRVPNTAQLEYSYLNAVNSSWPCYSVGRATPPGGTCPAATALPAGQKINFRGFLWVKGNLIIQSAARTNWNFSGVILVGDPSTNPPSGVLSSSNLGSLTLYYDDRVNRSISMNPLRTDANGNDNIELQPDVMRDSTF